GISNIGILAPPACTSISISLSFNSPSRSFLRKLSRVAGLAPGPTKALSTRSSADCSARVRTSLRFLSRTSAMPISTRSRTICSTSRPTYPTSVNLVASTLMKGAPASLARRREISVLPTPVGPIIRMFLGSTSSRSLSSSCRRRQRLRSAMATARLASAWPMMKRSSSETISRGEKSVMTRLCGACSSLTQWHIATIAPHEQYQSPRGRALFQRSKSCFAIGAHGGDVVGIGIGHDAGCAGCEPGAHELVDEARTVTQPDEVAFADELIDADRTGALVAIGMVGPGKWIIGLDVPDRTSIEVHQKAFDLGFIEMAADRLHRLVRFRTIPACDVRPLDPHAHQRQVRVGEGDESKAA